MAARRAVAVAIAAAVDRLFPASVSATGPGQGTAAGGVD